MAEIIPLSLSDIWSQIDLSESYLVCCMFEEAASLASSIIQRVCTTAFMERIDETQMTELTESAGMVFVQSLKELGRSAELFFELEMLFGSVAAIPAQVFLTGICIQISEGLSSNLKAIFEEFLGKWTHLEGEIYTLQKSKRQSSSSEESTRQSVMHAEKYVEVAEVYALTYLGMVLQKPDLAISWTERADLPEEKRQDMLRKLQSLHLATKSSSSLGPETIQKTQRNIDSGYTKEALLQTKNPRHHQIAEKSRPTACISYGNFPCFWWFRTIHLKFRNVRLVLPSGKAMLMGLLTVIVYYFVRKRSAVLKRVLSKQALSLRRTLVDGWQLAFSVNVNPLAAVQQLPAAPRGSR